MTCFVANLSIGTKAVFFNSIDRVFSPQYDRSLALREKLIVAITFSLHNVIASFVYLGNPILAIALFSSMC